MKFILYLLICKAESVLVPTYQTGSLDVQISPSGLSTQVVTFSSPFASIPQLLLSWRYVDVHQGPSHYHTSANMITQHQFTLEINSTQTIYKITVNWMAFIDDNVFVQYGEISQIISSQTLNVPINFLSSLSYIPNAAFLLNGITQTQTLTANKAAYRFAVNSVSASIIQIQVIILPGYAISWFGYTVVYGSPQYLKAGEHSFTILQPFQLFSPDARTKRYFIGMTSVQCQSNIRIKIVASNQGLVTPQTWATSIVTELTLSFIEYLPCPLYCTTCYASPPNCDGCVDSTQRSGVSCTTCPNQMFIQSDQMNCQQCNSYCNNCQGNQDNCLACKSQTLRSGLPSCTTCPSGMFLELFIDNCQPCQAYCNECFASAKHCVSCSQSTLRTNPPDCLTCPDQYHIILNTPVCQQCLPYCNNCLPQVSFCIACASSSLRINPPNCLECPEFMYLNGDTCTECNVGCNTCNQTGCLTCLAESTYLNSLNECVNCPSHCLGCDKETCYNCAGNCMQCDQVHCYKCKLDNYYIQDVNCIECPINCLTCDQSTCLTCIGPRSVKNNLCECNHPCLICNSVECLACISSDYRISRGFCQYCPSNCIVCDEQGNCLSGPQNCLIGTFDGQQVVCTQCIQGYYVEADFCHKCSSICLECVNQPQICTVCRFQKSNQQECQLCESQIGMYSNYQNNTCNTMCGDAIVAGQEQCDDGNSVQNDGCTNCNIDQGYSCTDLGCFRIIYPVPILGQKLSFDSPYNATKLFELTYNTPIIAKGITLELQLIPSINFTYEITNNDNQFIKIRLDLQEQLLKGEIKIIFANPTQILSLIGVEQQILYLQSDISDYCTLSMTESQISESIDQFTTILLILLIILICLAIVFGGLDIFWNLIDLLQTISYLKYINTVKPYYLYEFLNLFGFIQFQNLPLNSFFNSQNFVQQLIDGDQFTRPPKLIHQDELSSSTIINIIPIFNVLFTGTFIYLCAYLIQRIMRNLDSARLVGCINNIAASIFLYDLVYFIKKSCDSIQKQWLWSGLIRMFMSSTNDICFIICLGIYGIEFGNSQIIIRMDHVITILSLFGLVSITCVISNIAGVLRMSLQSQEHTFEAVFESLRYSIWAKYYNVILIHKNFLFMIFLVLVYNESIFQISSIILVQIIQIVLFLNLSPIQEQIERYKQLICQILTLIAEIQLGILVIDDHLMLFEYDHRHVCGWICIFSIVLIIVTQLCIDIYQQYQRYQKKYQLVKKMIRCMSCKKKISFKHGALQ